MLDSVREMRCPKHYVIFTVGRLSAPLFATIDQFSVQSETLVATVHHIPESSTNTGVVLEALIDERVDWAWVFINESEMLVPAVLDVISHARQMAPVLVECYLDRQNQDVDDFKGWPEHWPPDGKHGVILSPYMAEKFHALITFQSMAFGPPTQRRVEVFAGQEARAHDPYYERARDIVLEHRCPSVGLVQRRLHLGYRHAARLLDAMEGDILSTERQDGSRSLLIKPGR